MENTRMEKEKQNKTKEKYDCNCDKNEMKNELIYV